MSQPARAQRRCLCGALLARDNPEDRCAACQVKSRRQPVAAPEVPTEFWDHPAMRDALTQGGASPHQ
jgi:hypothetical protein